MKFLLLVAVVVAIWWLLRGRAPRGSAMSVAEARRILALGADADAGAVQDAHRRLIQRVHPDVGGTEELARRVNLARDALLAELDRRRVGGR